jgi:aldose 1-epimerase
MTGGRFSARIERDARIGPIAVLAWDGTAGDASAVAASRSLEARIVPGFGCNLVRFSVGGSAVIDFDPALLLAHDFTGTPVLYPTPNRVRDCRFTWKGRVYPQRRAGRDIYEHGLAHLESWEFEPPTASLEEARFVAWLECRAGCPMFEAFPFPHRISLEFTLTAGGIRVEYAIENRGAEELPFGFGLHPYFAKRDGEEGTFVSLPATAVMEATPELLPTGRLADVAGSGFDLRQPAAVGTLNVDHVFTRIEPGRHARVEYRKSCLAIDLEATGDFSHLILYAQRGKSHFCLENQTCSTDAHNLFARGFGDVAGLKTVAPGAVRRGSVTYAVSASSAMPADPAASDAMSRGRKRSRRTRAE